MIAPLFLQEQTFLEISYGKPNAFHANSIVSNDQVNSPLQTLALYCEIRQLSTIIIG